MKKIVNDLIDLSNDSDIISAYEKEEIEKYAYEVALKEKLKEGIKEGIEKNKIEVAKNLLKENIDINIISKTTGLSLKEIENLK